MAARPMGYPFGCYKYTTRKKKGIILIFKETLIQSQSQLL